MKVLIEEGLLTPGEGVLTSEYKGANMVANLNADGRISYMVCTLASYNAPKDAVSAIHVPCVFF